VTTRYHVGTAVPATADAAGVMAALATLFAVTLDVDTGATVSGLAWTRDTTAGSQAIYSAAFGPRNTRIIIAVHDSGTPSPSPTMNADTYTAANVLVGLADNAAGAYAGWNAAAPFSGCTFAGYYRLCAVAGVTTGTIRAWVSTKDLWLQTLTTTTAACHAGAVATGATGYQESDGYRYGLMVSGIGDMNVNWRSNTAAAAGYFGKNGAANGNAHAGLYQVAGSAWQVIRVGHIRIGGTTGDMSKWAAGVSSREGIVLQRATSPEYTIGSWSGVSDAAQGLTAALVNASGGALWGWLLSSSTSGGAEDSIAIGKTF